MVDTTTYTVASDSEATGEDPEAPPTPFVEVAVGIDVGTAYCSLALWKDSRLQVLQNSRGLSRAPSYVSLQGETPSSGVSSSLPDRELLSGSSIYNVKRLVGRMDTDPVVQTSKKYSFLLQTLDIGVRPFLAALSNDVWRSTTPEEVLAILLVELRAMAEAQLGRMVRSVVLTRPVAFSRFQQTRLERSCAMAGLHVLRVMPEPTAVALLYAQQQQQVNQGNMGSGMEKLALIFNMGAGFCDVAVTATAGGVSQIRALAGDVIGGEDLLQNTINYLLNEIGPAISNKCSNSANFSVLLRPYAEKAMHTLSFHTTARVEVEVGSSHKISKTLTRDEFEDINAGIFQKCQSLVEQCLRDAQVDTRNVADVVLVGGCTNIPKVRSLVQKACGGGAIYDGIRSVEAVVSGAALEGAIASGVTDPLGKLDLLTIQAMPHSLGIRVAGNEFFPILHRNVTMPSRRDINVTTSHDSQTEALIVVYEGESKQASENHLLGFFKISSIPLAPKGVPIISVCMDVDASDVMRVVAGVCLPDAEKPVLPLVEVRMPTVDDGHGWCTDAILQKYGSLFEVAVPPRPQTSAGH